MRNGLPPFLTIVLVDPQMGENIGAAARVMWNFGLSDLRLVRPRDGWPSAAASAMATRGAAHVIDNARVHDSVPAAIHDLTRVFAATGRERYMQKAVVEPQDFARIALGEANTGGRCGVLFGSERAGLENDDVSLADTIVSIACNADFSSLNLAQSVGIVAYEWFKATGHPSPARPALRQARPALKGDLIGLFEQLEAELDRVEFLYPPAKRAAMVRNIRNMWHRANLTYQDVQTIRGMITAIARAPRGRGDKV